MTVLLCDGEGRLLSSRSTAGGVTSEVSDLVTAFKGVKGAERLPAAVVRAASASRHEALELTASGTTLLVDIFPLAVEGRTLCAVVSREVASDAEGVARVLDKWAHDLKNPLTSVIGFSDLLADGGGTIGAEKRAEYLAMIRDAAKEILQTLDEARGKG